MKKLLFIILIAAVLFPNTSSAGISFPNTGNGTSDGVDIAPSANMNGQTAWTIMMWTARTQATITAGNRVATKGNQGGSEPGWQFAMSGTAGNVRAVHKRATTNTQYITNTTPLANNGEWVFLAVSFDAAGSSGNIFKIYAGNLKGLASLQTLGTTTNGSGTFTYDGGIDMCVGYDSCFTGSSGVQHKFASFAYVNRVMSEKEIQGWQFRMRRVPNMQVWHIYQKRSGNTIFDQSRNGIVASSTAASFGANDPPVIYGIKGGWLRR